MWPFNKKSATAASTTVSQGLQQLSRLGIRKREEISDADLLHSLGAKMDSKIDWVNLLCALGSEVERGDFARISDDIWHFDAECIEDNGDYCRVVERFAALAKESLPLKDITDHVDIENEEAWVEFTLDGNKARWDLTVSNDWVDPELYSRLQELVRPRGAGKLFFIAGLGQDSLICFGDDQMRQDLCNLSGLKFEWE